MGCQCRVNAEHHSPNPTTICHDSAAEERVKPGVGRPAKRCSTLNVSAVCKARRVDTTRWVSIVYTRTEIGTSCVQLQQASTGQLDIDVKFRGSSIASRASNVELRVSSVQHQTSSVERGTSNIERPALTDKHQELNFEHRGTWTTKKT